MPANPRAVIARRAAQRLAAGHVWVYLSDLEEPPVDAAPGSLIDVYDRRGALYGTATYSVGSQIALRMFSRECLTRTQFLDEIERRVTAAVRRRSSIFSPETDAARLVFSEADEMAGLIVDCYGELIIVQRNTQAMAAPDVRERIRNGLLAGTGDATTIRAIVERQDPRIRELEQLAPAPAEALYGDAGPLSTVFHLNGLTFGYDADAGQKTGAFLDQRENYAAAARYAALAPAVDGGNNALDICTYQGGFALHLARVCDAVTAVDQSRAALEVAEENAHRNGLNIEWLEGDAFAVLRDYAAAGRRYSTIVLDPPAFAKSKRAAEGALRGYKEMNLRALQMLPAGGILITCSCSHHVSQADFSAMLASAAADAGRRVQLLEARTAAPDHPVILTLPETFYLKCLICRVE